ncbi:DUF3157 family protein [Vibrio cholerae]|uniref:DUF3157 family protein n=1 Tax=Vibrio cholerae TaxID=666 RepID=UPI00021AA1C3|nr:DUF3157 family protein [Vibrio cholerae]EGS73339.1 hypothetical protein VCBJG01_0039 [Vibrio cholerae BJG-01]EJL6474350.1 DUF3157 family protein [Vibrio cholerae]EJL6931418.1 DUF3157 family protein [Vibrio cholerae]EKF9288262.1 DUF3157 family protein [Vibrio cholerae]EKF9441296.1 DUF3157 family protein [Vibrio cholerae]
MKKLILAASIVSLSTWASETVQLKDGRYIQLNDDFTWQYVPQETQPQQTSELAPLVLAAPVIAQPTLSGVTITVGDHRPVLQLSDSGVDVVLSAPRYEHGQLKLNSAITNQSSQSVIAVRLAIRVQDAQGVWSEEQEVTIWQSIKRMAETYLRPRTSVEGKPLEFNLAEQSQYTLHATIKQIETR